MSGHHYFQEFGCCDSGILPWLLWLQIQSSQQRPLTHYINERAHHFPFSGEMNRSVQDPEKTLRAVQKRYQDQALWASTLDGISLDFEHWRFNLRPSNTEALIRLNVESRGDRVLVQRKTEELLELIDEGA